MWCSCSVSLNKCKQRWLTQSFYMLKDHPSYNRVFLFGWVSRRSRKSTSTQHVFSLCYTTIQSVIANPTTLKVYLNVCGKQMVFIHCQPVVTKAFSKNCFPATVTSIINLSVDWINKKTSPICLRAKCTVQDLPQSELWDARKTTWSMMNNSLWGRFLVATILSSASSPFHSAPTGSDPVFLFTDIYEQPLIWLGLETLFWIEW